MAEERIKIPIVLENVLRYCLNEAQKRFDEKGELVPFSALAVGKNLFMEEHSGEEVEECFDKARRTVENARGASAYGFCYDGYVDMGSNQVERRDCLVAEGGCPGDPYGHAIGLTYKTKSDGTREYAKEPIYLGNSRNYMLNLFEFSDEEPAAAEGDAPEEQPGEPSTQGE